MNIAEKQLCALENISNLPVLQRADALAAVTSSFSDVFAAIDQMTPAEREAFNARMAKKA